MLSTSCELYYDDVTVTSFIDIKCGNVAVQSIPYEQYSVIRFPWAKASAYAIIHPELCALHSDKCFTKPAIHAWCNKFTNSH